MFENEIEYQQYIAEMKVLNALIDDCIKQCTMLEYGVEVHEDETLYQEGAIKDAFNEAKGSSSEKLIVRILKYIPRLLRALLRIITKYDTKKNTQTINNTHQQVKEEAKHVNPSDITVDNIEEVLKDTKNEDSKEDIDVPESDESKELDKKREIKLQDKSNKRSRKFTVKYYPFGIGRSVYGSEEYKRFLIKHAEMIHRVLTKDEIVTISNYAKMVDDIGEMFRDLNVLNEIIQKISPMMNLRDNDGKLRRDEIQEEIKKLESLVSRYKTYKFVDRVSDNLVYLKFDNYNSIRSDCMTHIENIKHLEPYFKNIIESYEKLSNDYGLVRGRDKLAEDFRDNDKTAFKELMERDNQLMQLMKSQLSGVQHIIEQAYIMIEFQNDLDMYIIEVMKNAKYFLEHYKMSKS